MESKGADNWKYALKAACRGGQTKLVEHIIDVQTNELNLFSIRYMMYPNKIWNVGLHHACRGGNLEIIELMISKGANYWTLDYMVHVEEDIMNIANYMISKGACNWNNALDYACRGGHKEMIDFNF